MKSRRASNPKRDKSHSPKLSAAMAFGFAAGALLAKKPAAAIAAVTTGLLTCFSLGRRRDEESDETEETIDTPTVVPLAVEPMAADAPSAPDTVEPLPALIEEASVCDVQPTDAQLLISLPEITPVKTTQATLDDVSPSADVARHLHDEWLRQIESVIARK